MSQLFSAVALASLMIFTLPAEACHKKKHRCGGGHHPHGEGPHGGGHRQPPPPRCDIPQNQYVSDDFEYNGEKHKLIVVVDDDQIVVTLRESDYDREYVYINKPLRPFGPRHGKPPHKKRGHGGPGGHCGNNLGAAMSGECKPRPQPVCKETTFRHAYGKGKLNPNGLLVDFTLVGNALSGGISIVTESQSSSTIELTLQPKLIPIP